MKEPAVNLDIAEMFLTRYLEGFRNFPRTPGGVRRFAEAVQEVSVSVEHLEAILKTFDEDFPTVRQINDVATNLKPRFEVQADSRAELERKYGKPEPFNKFPVDEMAMHWQAFRDIVFHTEGPGGDKHGQWETARMTADQEHPDSMEFVRQIVWDYQWTAVMQMVSPPQPMPYTPPAHRRREVRHFAHAAAAAIGQADIDRAIEQRKTTAQVDRELDAWSDPDR